MGFEVVVRPAVFPNIRPTARQSLPPQDDPEKGFAVIRGNPASTVDVSFSWSISMSLSSPTETERTYDQARVYQKDPDGTVNKDNFIDLQIPTKIKMDTGPKSGMQDWRFQRIDESDNIEITKRDQTR